jgi:pyruvate/2-oxoglutarate dehydrogenase complex dihydrolipoamide dehydrogenase (E3) component
VKSLRRQSSARAYDFVVIGGGSAGFAAARTAAALGRKVAIVDGARELGGLCILRGCMPSKTLLYTAEVLHLAGTGKKFGLKIPPGRPDLSAVAARKRRLIGEFAEFRVRQLTSGRYALHRAQARFTDPHTLELSDGTRLTGKKFLIGTGSKVAWPPVPGLRDIPCWSSDDALDLDFLPKSVIVLGGGIVACELSQYLNRMGAGVILVQRSPNILRDHSPAASAVVQQAFRDEGIELFAGTKVVQLSSGPRSGVTVVFEYAGRKITRRAAYCLNALGREANTAGLDLAAAGVRTRASGQVITNRFQQTSAKHIYAGGDCCGPHEIVHLAIQQGELAARHAFGQPVRPVDYSLLLNVVFTDPQLATIGRLESELKEKSIPYRCASYPFNDHGKSILMEANYGYVKVIAEPKRGRLLGAEIVGKDAGELIHCFSAPLAMKATVFDMLRAPWYHPTLAEIITYPLEELADQIAPKIAPRVGSPLAGDW